MARERVAVWVVLMVCVWSPLLSTVQARWIDFEEEGGIPNDSSLSTCWANARLLNQTLAALARGDTLYFPNTTFYLMGGIYAYGLRFVPFSFFFSLFLVCLT
jgi:hypothetical protein